MALSAADLERHKRHILLKDIGGPGVQKLRAAHVTLVGAGALGGPCALYLAAAGVGTLTLMDDDRVELSNLQRQVQFAEADIGALKASRLAERLRAIDPGLEVHAETRRFVAGETLGGELIIDATDNFPTRHALNDHAHATGRRLVSGAAQGWVGQVAVFASGLAGGAPCYRCLVPDIPPDAGDCDTMGVVGAVTGIVGSRMALEAIKLITGAGQALVGRLWILDGLEGRERTVSIGRDRHCATCGDETFL